MKIGIVDYGVGNLGSVARAFEELHANPILINRAIDIHSADYLVLPGVGSFTECKRLLDEKGWTHALTDEVLGYNKPILGICLGMQLLADKGMEGSNDVNGTLGLGFIPGQVRSLTDCGCQQRIPHMGWNSIKPRSSNSLCKHISDNTDFYFVHSYAFVAQNPDNILATTTYGTEITVAIGHKHIWGVQFHPEKSSKAGFRILQNFIEYSSC